ncbi:MAG: hypothetical protein ACOYL6_11330 [Bacteriovoracaceae bacterium]
MKTLVLAFIFLQQLTPAHGATANVASLIGIKGQVAEVKQPCHHVVIQNETSKDYFIGKVTEGPVPRPGDEVTGKFNSGHNYLDNLNQHEKFQFYAKGSFTTLGKAHVKLKEFCD